jgi:hypothetical protein
MGPWARYWFRVVGLAPAHTLLGMRCAHLKLSAVRTPGREPRVAVRGAGSTWRDTFKAQVYHGEPSSRAPNGRGINLGR